jgi:hypothetical protein
MITTETPSGYHSETRPIETFRGGAWTLDLGVLPDGRFALDHSSIASSHRQRLYFESEADARCSACVFLGLPV